MVTIVKKIQYGHHQELIAADIPSKIDHYDLPQPQNSLALLSAV